MSAVSPMLELGAYEVLWADPKMSFKKFGRRPSAVGREKITSTNGIGF